MKEVCKDGLGQDVKSEEKVESPWMFGGRGFSDWSELSRKFEDEPRLSFHLLLRVDIITMALRLPAKVTSIYENPLAIATIGVVIGFALGRFTAPISTANYLKASRTQQSQKSRNNAKPESMAQNDDEESDEQGELQDFKGSNEECKLVLVVRTDLGMTKGIIHRVHDHFLKPILTYQYRKNSCAMFPRNFSMLQSSCEARGSQQKVIFHAASVGELGTSKSHGSSQERRRVVATTSAGHEFGTLCKDHT
jgi:peptidyl-tRNA hydrolase